MGRIWKRVGDKEKLCGNDSAVLQTHYCFYQNMNNRFINELYQA